MIKWNESLNTGIPIIDNQHRKILEQINKSIELLNRGQSTKVIVNSIEKLELLVNTHNTTEEKFMKQYNYPETDKHILDHRIFNKNIVIVKTAISRSINGDKLQEIFNSQSDVWFSKHILEYDKKMAEYLLKRM